MFERIYVYLCFGARQTNTTRKKQHLLKNNEEIWHDLRWRSLISCCKLSTLSINCASFRETDKLFFLPPPIPPSYTKS